MEEMDDEEIDIENQYYTAKGKCDATVRSDDTCDARPMGS